MHPRALPHPSTPPPWSQNPRKRPRTRKQYPPAPAPIVTPLITSPPGYPRLLASARREPIEPAQWPPSPPSPYQGSGHWRPKMQSASMMRAMRAQTVQEMVQSSTVAEWRVNNIKSLAPDRPAAPSIVKLTVAHFGSGSGSSDGVRSPLG